MARELRIVVTADGAQAKRELSEVEKSTQNVTKATGDMDKSIKNATGSMSAAELAAIGLTAAFAIEKIIGFAREVGRFAGEMNDLSARTGIGVERLQALNVVGADVGVTVDQMADALAQLSRRLVGEDPGAVAALERLGLKAKELIALSPDQQLFAIAEAISQIPNPTERSAVAMELLGRSGAKMLPLLTDGFKQLTLEAERSGAVMSKDIIDKADAFDDFFSRAWIQTRALAATLGGEFVEALSTAQLGEANLTASTQVLSKAMEMTDDGLAGAVDQATKALKRYAGEALPNLTLSTAEADRISRELTESAKESIRTHEAEAKAVERSEAAYRQYTNWIEERHIEAVEKQIEATERMRDELNKLERTTGDYLITLGKQADETQRTLDEQEAAWRQYNNMVGELLMEQDRLAMETTTSISGHFKEMFADMWSGIDTTMTMIDDLFGNKLSQASNNWGKMWRGAQQEMHGMVKLMRGDLTGLIDVIKGTISWVKGLWGAMKGLFGGGEEGTVVNPARDTFLSQWGDPSNKGVGGAGHNLAALLTSLGAGEGGGSIFAALQNAETMAIFRPAAQAIVEFLTSKGESASMNFAIGGMVPRDGLAMVHRDEGVLTPRGVAAVGGPDAVSALNRGDAGWMTLADRIDSLGERLEAMSSRQAALIPLLARDAAMKAMA